MDLGEKGTILANFGPNPTLIRENEESTRSDHPNSDIVEGIAPTTEINLKPSFWMTELQNKTAEEESIQAETKKETYTFFCTLQVVCRSFASCLQVLSRLFGGGLSLEKSCT